jgi:hypothetical protein
LGPRGIGRGISNMEKRRELACICVIGKRESRDWMCSDRDWWIAGRSDERSILLVSFDIMEEV